MVEKFSPDGTANWSKNLEENVSEPYFLPSVWNENIGMPLYLNGMIYVPVEKGVIALE